MHNEQWAVWLIRHSDCFEYKPRDGSCWQFLMSIMAVWRGVVIVMGVGLAIDILEVADLTIASRCHVTIPGNSFMYAPSPPSSIH